MARWRNSMKMDMKCSTVGCNKPRGHKGKHGKKKR